MMHARLIPVLLVLMAVGGCGGPSFTASPANPIATAVQEESGEYSVLAAPYSDSERQQAVFDADLVTAGIIAIQLQVHNATGPATRVRRQDMTLTLPNGHYLSPMSAHSVANVVEEKTGTSFAADDVIAGVLDLATNGVLGGNPQPARDQRRAEQSRAKRIADYESKQFKDTLLTPGESTHGFVFFRPPPGTAAFDTTEFNIQFNPAAGVGGLAVSRTISGLGFPGSESDPAATYVPRSQRGFKRCDLEAIGTRQWIGNWEARDGRAKLTVDISSDSITGKITTPTHVYRVSGVVNGDGNILADIQYGDTRDKITLDGDFPILRTGLDSSGAGDFWPLNNAVFRLCIS